MFHRKKNQSDRAFTLVELLVVIAIIGVLVSLLLPAVQSAREAARRMQCKNNIRQLALAVLNYESTNKTLPIGIQLPLTANPATTTSPGVNWVISILPFFEQASVYDAFDLTLPISNVANEQARSVVLSAMLCPSDEKNQEPMNSIGVPGGNIGDNWARGNYACNAGNGPTISNWSNSGIWGPDSAGWLDPLRKGLMGPNVSVQLREVTDGLTNVIMLAEIRAGLSPGDRRGTWALGTAGASMVAWYGATGDANGPNACYRFADDVAGCLPELQNEYQSDCMSCFSDDQWNDQAAPRSTHPGGVHVALGDASVRWISDAIETSGRNSQCCKQGNTTCCTPWDKLILSGDGFVVDNID